MRSDLKKISKDLLIYSALVSDYEPLDFKNDALAGVRANYFNAGTMPQSEKTELVLDSKPLNLSYSMKNGEPLSWKAIYNNHMRIYGCAPNTTARRILQLQRRRCIQSSAAE